MFSHLKIGLLPQKETIVFQPSIFRCSLRLREGNFDTYCIPGTLWSFVLPPKEGLFQLKQGTFGFQVYTYLIFTFISLSFFLSPFHIYGISFTPFQTSRTYPDECWRTVIQGPWQAITRIRKCLQTSVDYVGLVIRMTYHPCMVYFPTFTIKITYMIIHVG